MDPVIFDELHVIPSHVWTPGSFVRLLAASGWFLSSWLCWRAAAVLAISDSLVWISHRKVSQRQHLLLHQHNEKYWPNRCILGDWPCADDTFLQLCCEKSDVFRQTLVLGFMSTMFGALQTELSDGIAVLVASNDHIQEHISQMEEMCHTIEVSRMGRSEEDEVWSYFWPLTSGEWKAAARTAGRPFLPPGGDPGGAETGAGGAHQQGAGPQAQTSSIAHPALQRRAGGRRGAGGVGYPVHGGATHVCLYSGGLLWLPR